MALFQEVDHIIVKMGRRAANARTLLNHLYVNPTVTVNQVSELLGSKYLAANQLISALVDVGIIAESTGWQRNRMFIFRRYLQIFDHKNKI